MGSEDKKYHDIFDPKYRFQTSKVKSKKQRYFEELERTTKIKHED